MTAEDEEALTWEGDESRRAPIAPTRRPTVVDHGVDDARRAERGDSGQDAPRPASSALLVTLGVLGGVHVLWAVGWLIAGLRLLPVAQYLVTPAGGSVPPLWQSGMVLAVTLTAAAPIIWCAAALVLTRATRPWVRIVALLAGAVLLVPWPFVSVGAVGT